MKIGDRAKIGPDTMFNYLDRPCYWIDPNDDLVLPLGLDFRNIFG